MPNHVTNEITFAAEHAERVFAHVISDGRFDFETLIPSPPHKYHSGLSLQEDQDFKCNWHTWNRENWGTKWNAYSCSNKVDGDKAVIRFDTAWSVPYPVLAAFCNRFQIPFEHRYFEEGSNFWGIETWGKDRHGSDSICRITKRYKNQEDYAPLCIHLTGYDPATVEEDEE